MPPEPGPPGPARHTPGAGKAWRRFLAWIASVDAALNTTHDDIQDQRILALERQVALLQQSTATATAIEHENQPSGPA